MIQDNRTTHRARVRWTELVLHFADGSGLVSVWDAARACAVQRDGPRQMTEARATAEHLRALAEFHDTGGCTNWLPSTTTSTLEPPSLEHVDWSGFDAPDPEQ